MIIKLHNSLLDYLNQDRLTDNEIEVFADIASFRKKGRGFVLANKELLQKLIEYKNFAQYTKSSYIQIYRDQTKWFNLIKNFNFIISITSDSYQISEHESRNPSEIFVKLSSFNNREPVVIAENTNDIKFFTSITKSYIALKGISGVSFCYRTVLGGGDTTYQVINDHQKDNDGPAICILDSDKTFPNSELGSTAKKVLKYTIPNELTKIIITNSREVENIIPFKILRNIFNSNKAQLKKINEYEKYRDIKFDKNSPVKYIDFKKGVKLSLANQSDGYNGNIYWDEIFNHLGITQRCNCPSLKKCTCTIVDGFGSDILRSTVENLEKNPFCFSEVEDIYQDELAYICENLIPFILAPHALAS